MHPTATEVVNVQSPVGTPNTGKLGYPPDTSDPHFLYNLGETCRERSITIVSPRLEEAMHVHGPPSEYSGGLLACLLRAAHPQLGPAAGGGIYTREEKKRCMPRPLTLTENLLAFFDVMRPDSF